MCSIFCLFHICVTSIFFKFGGTSIFLRSCGIGGRATCCHQFFSRQAKTTAAPAGTCRVLEQHYLRHNKNRNTNQLSDLKPNTILVFIKNGLNFF
jgi:hypothetical protein